jgi:hypothetical protein
MLRLAALWQTTVTQLARGVCVVPPSKQAILTGHDAALALQAIATEERRYAELAAATQTARRQLAALQDKMSRVEQQARDTRLV